MLLAGIKVAPNSNHFYISRRHTPRQEKREASPRVIRKTLRLFFCAVLISWVGCSLYFTFGPSGPWGTTENEEDREIFIPQGSGFRQIAEILKKEKALRQTYGFMLRALLMNKAKTLQAGEYLIPSQGKIGDLIEKISSGNVTHRSFTVIEGSTVADILAKLKDNKFLLGEMTRIPEEGRLLPATYPYHRGEERQSLIDRMEKAMETVLLELWESRPGDCLLKTPDEALTMASIIEKESSTKLYEQPRIAGVFFNRIKKNMRLQSDPTVIYALTKGQRPLGRPLTRNDLKHDSFYNTYRYAGLPPTPIACPRKEAIEAALNPNTHEELYFVANGIGGHNFAKTLDDHYKNVQKWRSAREG